MECPRRLSYWCHKAREEVAYISLPNIANRGFENKGWTTNFLPVLIYTLHQLMHHANLHATLTHTLCQKLC